MLGAGGRGGSQALGVCEVEKVTVDACMRDDLEVKF